MLQARKKLSKLLSFCLALAAAGGRLGSMPGGFKECFLSGFSRAKMKNIYPDQGNTWNHLKPKPQTYTPWLKIVIMSKFPNKCCLNLLHLHVEPTLTKALHPSVISHEAAHSSFQTLRWLPQIPKPIWASDHVASGREAAKQHSLHPANSDVDLKSLRVVKAFEERRSKVFEMVATWFWMGFTVSHALKWFVMVSMVCRVFEMALYPKPFENCLDGSKWFKMVFEMVWSGVQREWKHIVIQFKCLPCVKLAHIWQLLNGWKQFRRWLKRLALLSVFMLNMVPSVINDFWWTNFLFWHRLFTQHVTLASLQKFLGNIKDPARR